MFFAAQAPAQVCSAVPVDCLKPVAVADEAVRDARFTYGATGSDGGDAWVARYDGSSKEPRWRTVIAGAGTDVVQTVSAAGRGVLLVAGSTTSPSLPSVTGRNNGGQDGLVLRLDALTGRILSGAFVGGAGNEQLTGVVAAANGNVLVSGSAPEGTTNLGAAPAQLTRLVPEAAPTAATTNVVLTTLYPDLSRVLSRYVVGKWPIKWPRVWLDCWGNPVIGVVMFGDLVGDGCGGWPDLTYEQSHIGSDYDLDHDLGADPAFVGFPPGGWGYHALRWKNYRSTPTYTYNTSAYVDGVTTPEIPKWWNPNASTAADLNTLETMLFTPADPPGGWSAASHGNLGELSLITAYMFSRWGTPVYTELGNWDDLDGSWDFHLKNVGLERVVFTPYCVPGNEGNYSGQGVEDLCDLTVNSINDVGCTSTNAIPGVNGPGFLLRLKKFEGTHYTGFFVWYLRLVGWDPIFDWWYEEWYDPGDYVFDPPDGAEKEVAVVQQAARQLSGQVAVGGRVYATRLVNGQEACKSEYKDVVIPADR